MQIKASGEEEALCAPCCCGFHVLMTVTLSVDMAVGCVVEATGEGGTCD